METGKKRIVCFGDSNTWGFIPGSGQRYDENTRWTGRLQTLLGYGYAVVEAGLNGRTTIFDNPFAPHTNGSAHMKPMLLSAAPIDLLIFMLGTNDFQVQIGSDPLTTANACAFLLEEARKMGLERPGGEMKLLLIAPTSMEDCRIGYKPLDCIDASGVEKSRRLPAYLRLVAEQLGCAYLDTNDYIRPGGVDGTHWGAQQHATMAQVIFETVKTLLP